MNRHHSRSRRALAPHALAWAGAALLCWACGHGSAAVASHAAGTDAAARVPRAVGQAGWEEIHTGGAPGRDAPNAGEDEALAYDPARHRLLLYGGKGDDDKNCSELWAFDVTTRTWSQIQPVGELPTPREDHTLVLDAGNDALVLYGGENGPTVNETWVFDLKTSRWSNVTRDSAPKLESHVAVYDPHKQRMVVFGGMQETLDKKGEKEKEIQDDTWALDLTAGKPGYGWSKLDVKGTPPGPRREHKCQYDPVRQRMIIFGGRQRSRTSFLDDVWILDLADDSWHELATTGERPNPIRQTALGYDPEADTLTVFGGEVHIVLDKTHEEERTVNQVWVLDLASGIWSDRTPYPPPMYDHVGAFVPELGGTVIYGGSSHKIGKEHSTWLLRLR